MASKAYLEPHEVAEDAAKRKTMAQHTPGPWTVQRAGTGELLIAGGVSPDPVTRARYLFVARVGKTRDPNPLWRQEEESEANARLIAAAPALLAALETIANKMGAPIDGPKTPEDGDDYMLGLWHCAEVARAALAKAKAPS